MKKIKSLYRVSEGGKLKEEGEQEDNLLTLEEAWKRMNARVGGIEK